MLLSRLDSEPLFHASRGSKELFHLDLLAWMVRTYSDRLRRVFEPYLVPGASAEVRVRREYRHLDLVVEFPGCAPLVIENKAFALPDERQLERYGVAVSAHLGDASLVLLGLSDPGWPGARREVGGLPWRWMSYRELGERLAAEFADEDDFGLQVVRHESVLVGLLHELMESHGVRGAAEPYRLENATHTDLDSVGLADAMGKARAHQVMRLIAARLESESVRAPAWDLEVGLTNKQPLLAAFWRVREHVVVGWQAQGRQWRLAMILTAPDVVGRGSHAKRAAFAAEHADYFEFGPMYELLQCSEVSCMPVTARTPPHGFNRYDPDFVYRYRLLPDVTVEQLVDLAVVYSKHAAEWTPGR